LSFTVKKRVFIDSWVSVSSISINLIYSPMKESIHALKLEKNKNKEIRLDYNHRQDGYLLSQNNPSYRTIRDIAATIPYQDQSGVR